MPYLDGKRVSQDEFIRAKRIAEGRDPNDERRLHTGPRGENPGQTPDIDEATGAPVSKSKKKNAGSERSKRTTATVNAAVADALGVKPDSPALADIDASGLDDEDTEKEDA